MELLLNLVWALVVALAFTGWLVLRPRDRKRALLGLGALLCICVLLLPVISASDDLYGQVFTTEDGYALKRFTQHSTPDHGTGTAVLLCFIVAALSVQVRREWLPTRRSRLLKTANLLIEDLLGRAPPLTA